MPRVKPKPQIKAKPKRDDRVGPTEAQCARSLYVSAGMAHRRVPMIDQMLKRDQITHKEHAALAHYRDQASLAESSPVKSCLDRSIRAGNGNGPSAAVISAMLETARIERALGSLLDIARAVAVEDKSLSQWLIDKHGGRERYDGQGRFIALVPVGERKRMEIARLELRMAARRIAA
jgi:hypothetical protein